MNKTDWSPKTKKKRLESVPLSPFRTAQEQKSNTAKLSRAENRAPHSPELFKTPQERDSYHAKLSRLKNATAYSASEIPSLDGHNDLDKNNLNENSQGRKSTRVPWPWEEDAHNSEIPSLDLQNGPKKNNHKQNSQRRLSKRVPWPWEEEANHSKDINNPLKMDDIQVESMTGIEYEHHCAKVLENSGWHVGKTPKSGDKGADLIATKGNPKVCIQCKRKGTSVQTKAVQEVYAGKAFYKGTDSVVVSNSNYTKGAKELAESTNVILISDTELEDLETML